MLYNSRAYPLVHKSVTIFCLLVGSGYLLTESTSSYQTIEWSRRIQRNRGAPPSLAEKCPAVHTLNIYVVSSNLSRDHQAIISIREAIIFWTQFIDKAIYVYQPHACWFTKSHHVHRSSTAAKLHLRLRSESTAGMQNKWPQDSLGDVGASGPGDRSKDSCIQFYGYPWLQQHPKSMMVIGSWSTTNQQEVIRLQAFMNTCHWPAWPCQEGFGVNTNTVCNIAIGTLLYAHTCWFSWSVKIHIYPYSSCGEGALIQWKHQGICSSSEVNHFTAQNDSLAMSRISLWVWLEKQIQQGKHQFKGITNPIYETLCLEPSQTKMQWRLQSFESRYRAIDA